MNVEKYLEEVTNRGEFEQQRAAWLADISESTVLKESARTTLTILE